MSHDQRDIEGRFLYAEFGLTLLTILRNQEKIMSTLQDLSDTLTTIDGKVTAVAADVDALIAKLAAIPTAGLTPEQQLALDAAVVHAQAIATSLGAIDTKVNPPAPPAP